MSGHQREVGEPGTDKAARRECVSFFHRLIFSRAFITQSLTKKKGLLHWNFEDGKLAESDIVAVIYFPCDSNTGLNWNATQ